MNSKKVNATCARNEERKKKKDSDKWATLKSSDLDIRS